MDTPPSFRAEIYYLVAKFLENGPCQNAASALRKDLEANELVPQRYDWKGNSHRKTFKDMEDEFGNVPDEYLLRKCFDLCTKLNPGSSAVRSMLQKERKFHVKKSNFLQKLTSNQVGITDQSYQAKWHSQLAKSMKLLRRTFGHLSSVYCLIFDKTGRLVITGADDMLVKVWSFTDARLIHTFRGASAEISDLAVSPDNKLVAAGSCDRVIRVWELHTGSPVAVLTKHMGTITAINFCPYLLNDYRFLASTSGDGTVSFWRYKYDEYGHSEFDPQPTRYHEKIRPGNTQMICAAFSPGGIFFVVGSADQNVRVYKMDELDGPVRILEEELHEDRVESIQWCNTPNELRFISGSRDGTARIWTFAHQRWKTLVLNMRTGDNSEPSKKKDQAKPPQQTQVSTSRSGRTTSSLQQNLDENSQGSSGQQSNQEREEKKIHVTMVAWSLDDAFAYTAVSDWTLKIWDSHKGTLLHNLKGHENDIFVLEPHPCNMNLLLTAAHDGHIIVWDLETQSILFKHRNIIEDEGQMQGHGPVFDAKWSKDGTTICASDSHGHVMFIGHGSSERYNKCPTELFFHTDYRPLLRDSFHNVVDEQTQLPPHLLPPPFLVDSEGDPYPAYIQRLVRGRENMSERDGLVPTEPEPSFQAPHQHVQDVQEEQDNEDEEQQENPEERLDRFRNEMLRNVQNQQQNQADEQQDNEQNNEENNATHTARTTKLVILKDNVDQHEIDQKIEATKACSMLETALFISEANKDVYDHDYARPVSNKAKAKTKKEARQRRQPEDEEEDEEEEEEENTNANGDNEDETSDCSLDESDFASAESTTDVSSEHSDWGSDHEQDNTKEPRESRSTKEEKAKKPSPNKSSKKKRHAAQQCREKMLLPGGDVGEQFMPSPWLNETIPRKTPYFPQIGDVLMYFKSGHSKYIELVELRKAYKLNMREQQWMRKKNLDEATMVKVTDINWEIRPPRLCVLKLAILNQSTSESTGENLTIKYHDMNDVVDFMVLYQAYNSHKGKHWKKGDRIRCQIDDKWWKGTVSKAETKESPFLSIFVHWDNGDKEYLSPWDLEFLDKDSEDVEDGQDVSVEQLKKSLYIPTSEEWNNIGRESESLRISEALAIIMELAIAEPFNYPVDLTVYPEYMVDVEYPMDLSCIKSRVDNHFYRRIEAIKHDLKYLYTNAASFNRPRSDIVRNAKTISKLACEIIGDTSKTKDDVSAIYHRLVESFEWSESDSDDDEQDDDQDENDDEEEDKKKKSSRRPRRKMESPNLNPKKWKHDCNEMLNEMNALPFSVPFREPVSEIDFPDYHRFIATPMDLSTVRESLMIGDYNSPLDLQKDVKLIFKNSKEYNTNPKSKVLAMTHKLEEWFEGKIGTLVHDWRMTMRRLTIAKRKHKAKKAEQSPDYKGKGKGKGKGQSNNINRKRTEESSEDDDDEDSDYENPQPGPSRSSPVKKKPMNVSRAAPPLRNAITAANEGRRTSSRQSRPPLRFQDEDEEDEEEEEQPQPKRVRPTREPVPAPTAEASSSLKRELEDDDDEEEVPLAKKANIKKKPEIKEEDEEEEPLVKRSSRKVVVHSESEEDVPLASRRKPNTVHTKPPPPSSSSSLRHSSRPSRPNKRYEETESEEERPVRRSNKRSRRPSSSSSPKRSSRRRPPKKAKKSSRHKSKRSRRESSESESESESSSSSESSEESEEEEIVPSKRSSRSSRPAFREEPEESEEEILPSKRSSRSSRPAFREEPEESEEEILPQRKRRQMDERNSRRMSLSAGPSSSGGRKRNVKRPVYFEDDDEEEEENLSKRSRRPARTSKRSRDLEYNDEDEDSPDEESNDSDSDDSSDEEKSASREKAYLNKKKKKTMITSRGRVSKPNPRII